MAVRSEMSLVLGVGEVEDEHHQEKIDKTYSEAPCFSRDFFPRSILAVQEASAAVVGGSSMV